MSRLASMGLELEELADGGETVELRALVEHAEDRGRPASHYLAAIPLATELRVAPTSDKLTAKICAGTCQRYGALDLLDHATGAALKGKLAIVPVSCLDRCDQGPACELAGEHGNLVLAPATAATLDEAIAGLT